MAEFHRVSLVEVEFSDFGFRRFSESSPRFVRGVPNAFVFHKFTGFKVVGVGVLRHCDCCWFHKVEGPRLRG